METDRPNRDGDLATRLAADAARCFGPERAANLAESIEATARMLERIAAVPLLPDDEPDFIR